MPTALASVYVIGRDTEPQKIGVSGVPASRLTQLRRWGFDDLNVNWRREYRRDIALKVESIIKKNLADLHLGREFYDLSIAQSVLAITIAERICYCIELPRMDRALRLDADRVALGLTKYSLLRRLGMAENAFSSAFSATLRGKVMERTPDLLDRIEVALDRHRSTDLSGIGGELCLTPEMNPGDIRNSGGSHIASRELVEGSRPRQ